MNTPSPTLRPLTGNQLVDALTNGTYWVLDGTRTLTWALADYLSFQWSSIQSNPSNIAQAYAAFGQFIDVRFEYQGRFTHTSLATADLVASLDGSWLFFSNSSSAALGYFPNSQLSQSYVPSLIAGRYPSAPGDIWLNMNVAGSLSLSPGAGGFTVFMHEIGHTLGLKHPHDSGGTGRPTFVDIGLSIADRDWFTIMSYDESYPLSTLLWHPVTPMIGDVIALQYIYGVNLRTNAGDTTHTLGNNNMFQTLFDASGNDTLDFSTSSQAWDISLEISAAGSKHPYVIGLALPIQNLAVPTSLYWLYGTFERVVGSAQSDSIVGSAGSDTLLGLGGSDYIASGAGNDVIYGGAGNDTVDGGSGIDIAVLSGLSANYRMQRVSATSFTLVDTRGTDGTDTLTSIERLSFSGSMVALDMAANDSGGMAALLLGAVLGSQSLYAKKALLGSVINLFDAGLTFTELSGAVMRLDIWETLAGSNSNTDIATYLMRTVTGAAPGAAVLSAAVTSLEESRGDYLWHLAASTSNQFQINLTGLSQFGLEYY
jgi:hypothetical protein